MNLPQREKESIMNKDDMIQVAEEEWLTCYNDDRDWMMEVYGTVSPDIMPMPWFWLILAESIEWKANIRFNVIARERLSHN